MGRINRRRDRWLKRALEWAARPWFRRSRLTLEQIQAESPRRVLIVRQHNQMGDMLCAVPAFRAIRQSFPGARTMLITAPLNHGVVQGNPYLDEILLFDKVEVRSSPARAWHFLRSLRDFRADLAIVLNTVSFSSTSAWLAVLSGSERIIGGDSTPFGWSFSRWLYNLEMPLDPEVRGHAIDHGLQPLAAVGISTSDRSTLIVPHAAAVTEARAFLQTLEPGPRLAIHPGAGKRENQWPAERFAAAIEQARSWGATPYLLEGPVDGPATLAAQAALGDEAPVLRDVGLPTVAAALAQSDAALVNDTGVMHVAGAAGVRTLALFGPTAATSWKPPGAHVEAIQSPDGTMEGISVARVVERLRSMLNAAGSGRGDRPG